MVLHTLWVVMHFQDYCIRPSQQFIMLSPVKQDENHFIALKGTPNWRGIYILFSLLFLHTLAAKHQYQTKLYTRNAIHVRVHHVIQNHTVPFVLFHTVCLMHPTSNPEAHVIMILTKHHPSTDPLPQTTHPAIRQRDIQTASESPLGHLAHNPRQRPQICKPFACHNCQEG